VELTSSVMSEKFAKILENGGWSNNKAAWSTTEEGSKRGVAPNGNPDKDWGGEGKMRREVILLRPLEG